MIWFSSEGGDAGSVIMVFLESRNCPAASPRGACPGKCCAAHVVGADPEPVEVVDMHFDHDEILPAALLRTQGQVVKARRAGKFRAWGFRAARGKAAQRRHV